MAMHGSFILYLMPGFIKFYKILWIHFFKGQTRVSFYLFLFVLIELLGTEMHLKWLNLALARLSALFYFDYLL